MNELSRHIEILLLDNDCVIVPGFGGFVAHHREAERVGDTFYPPQRSIGFNVQLQLNDSLLAQSYVEAYDISYPEAVRRLEAQVEEVKQRIVIEGEYEFHGIGVIRLDSDGRYIFEPCQAGLLTPSLYGFDSFTIDELTSSEEVNTLLEGISKQNTVVADSQTVISDSETVDEEEYEHHTLYLPIVKYAAAAILILLVFVFSVLPSDRRNDDVLLCSVINPYMIPGIKDCKSTVKHTTVKVKKEVVSTEKVEEVKPTAQPAEQTTQQAEPVAQKETETVKQEKEYFAIILASKITRSGAEEFVAKLSDEGLKEAAIYERGTMRRVIYGHYTTEEKAHEALRSLRDESEIFADAWTGEVKPEK